MFDATTTAIDNGIVASTKWERLHFLAAWCRWISCYFPCISTTLRRLDRKFQIDLLAAFAQHVRTGGVSTRQRKVRAQKVQVALRAISTTLQLNGEQNCLADTQGRYPKAIIQLLEGFRQADPPSQPKLTIPLQVSCTLFLQSIGSHPKQQVVGNLALIAFYYLLQVGEYTYHKKI